MKKLIILILSVFFVACASAPREMETPYANSDFIDHDWAMNSLWEDGQAEVAYYDAEMIIYGKLRSFDNVFITVKEEFNEAFNVKTDDYSRDDLFSVMKVNKFLRLETENYPYHFLSSLFFKREKPEQLYKMTHTGQEWCGNTFKQFEVTPIGYAYDYNSYFDGYGDGFRDLEGNDMLWEDQLSYVLRAIKFQDGLNFSKRVVDSQINTKTKVSKVYEANFEVSEKDSVWQITATLEEGKTNTYTFEKRYPYLMQSQKTWYGYNLKLNKVSRYQYWR